MGLKRLCALLVGAMTCLAMSGVRAEQVRVMSFNIRYGTAPDGENAWPHRKELVVGVIEKDQPDLVGLQEAIRDQVDYLVDSLGTYEKVGVGREPNGGGEYSAILYRRDRFDLSDAGTFWLSDAPETPGSKTWGNELPRICTWARLLDRSSGRRFLMVNTHWDHQSQEARQGAAELMAKRIGTLTTAGEPVIVTGDYNASPENRAFKTLLEQGALHDTFRKVHPDEKNISTFNGFGAAARSPKIDAVLVSEQWESLNAEIVRTKHEDRYPSDHFPISAVIELSTDETAAK